MWTDFVRRHCCSHRLLNELSSRQLAILPGKLPVDSPGPWFLYLLNSSPKKPDLAKTGKCICRQIFLSNQFEGKRAFTQLNLVQEVWGTGGHTANQKLIFRPFLFLLIKHIKIPEREKNRRFPHQGSALGLDLFRSLSRIWQPHAQESTRGSSACCWLTQWWPSSLRRSSGRSLPPGVVQMWLEQGCSHLAAAWTCWILPLNWCRFCFWPWRRGIWRSLCSGVHLHRGSRGDRRQHCTGCGALRATPALFPVTDPNSPWHKPDIQLQCWLSRPHPSTCSNLAPALQQGLVTKVSLPPWRQSKRTLGHFLPA